MNDRPLSSGEQTAIILAAFVVSPLLLLVLWFWWRDTSPQRAKGVADIAKWFVLAWLILFGLILGGGLIAQFSHLWN